MPKPYTFTADEEQMLSDAADLEQADAFMTDEEREMLEEWETGEDDWSVHSRYYLNNL